VVAIQIHRYLLNQLPTKDFLTSFLLTFYRKQKRAPIKPTSYLAGLKSICKNPSFNIDNCVKSLYKATHRFDKWLEQRVEVDVWLPSIDKKTTIEISRESFLKMCGNISKHNFLRLGIVANELKEILGKSSRPIEIDDALLSLADFYKRFHSDIFNYHSSTIAEFLNNIRWGIYEYLQPEFRHSIVWEGVDPPKYRYTYPEMVTTKLARECYWEIMNEVLDPPYVRRFEVTKWLKLCY
jgi:hypothetical protein